MKAKVVKRLTKKEKETLEKRRKYNQKWAKHHKEYFIDYYEDNKTRYRKAFVKYSKTEKGLKAIARYENSDERRKKKTEWMRKARKEGRVV